MSEHKNIDQLCVNTIRTLAPDVVQKANSGHPGMPMGMAPIAHMLWRHHLRFNPKNHKWMGRDRFVLSNGHGCTLQYILLHLAGFPLSMDDLKSFRQLNSKTPGHPEAHMTEGIEVSTGPLGQGIANGVGMAMAEAHLAARFNKPGFTLFDNYTYVFLGDGCMQEGISHEAASLAGHLGLHKLICFYDDNKITIDGDTELSFSEDVCKRHEAYGWHTITVEHGDNDLEALNKAIKAAHEVKDKPVLVKLRTTIGFGSKAQGTEKVHGAPLGEEDIAHVKTALGFDPKEKFFVPKEVYGEYADAAKRGAELEAKWNATLEAYTKQYPKEGEELARRLAGKLPDGWEKALPRWTEKDKPDATRNLSHVCLNAIAPLLPELIGGSADLTGSNKTELKCSKDFLKHSYQERYLRFGVREHGMAAIGNGIAAYGCLLPFTATFFNFIEYCFPSVRLAALSHHQQIFLMSHDSIGLGEDGPTHQPVEAATLCRATPNLVLIRPADGNECSGAYMVAVNRRHAPTVITTTRQNLPHLPGSKPEMVAKGGYVIQDSKEKPDLVLVGTGGETYLAVEAANLLNKFKVRVVSMPSWELFDKQPVEYRREVLPEGVPVVSVETSAVTGWDRYSHYCVGMTTFGASAPLKDVFKFFGFTGPQIAETVTKWHAAYTARTAALGRAAEFPLLACHFDRV